MKTLKIRFFESLAKNHREILLLMLMLLLGAGLRAYRLDYQSLWTDEIFTFNHSSKSVEQIVLYPDRDISIQLLYYLIVHPLIGAGNNQDALLRVPSLLFGSLSIVLFYLVVRNWLGPNIAILSAAIMAISPFHIWYSQEARPYALLIFLSLLSLRLLQEILKGQSNLWLKFGFVISTALTFYSHTVGIAFIGSLLVYVLLVTPSQKLREWLPIFIGIFIFILPGLYRMAIMPPIVRGSPTWRPFNPLSIPYVIWAFSTGYSLGPTLTELHMPDRMNTVLAHFPIILPVMVIFSALLMLGVFRVRKQNNSIFWCTTLWFVFPLAFAVFGAIFTPNEFNVRYSILSFPPFVVFLIVGIHGLRVKWVRAGLFVFVGLMSALSLGNHFFDERYHKDNNRAAGRFLSTHALPNDLVICSAGYTYRNLKHYYARNDLDMVRYPTGALFVKRDRIEPDLNKIIAERRRFWLFLSRTYHSDPKGYIRKYCDGHFRRDLVLKSTGVELVLYKKLPNNSGQRDELSEGIFQELASVRTGIAVASAFARVSHVCGR